MTRQCAWCKQSMGQAAPVDDEGVTHGICHCCGQRVLREAGVRQLPDGRFVRDGRAAESVCRYPENG